MINYVSVNDIKTITDINKPFVDILCDNVPVRIEFSKQKTGYGEKLFMKCPVCGERREKLYFINGLAKCRECIPQNVYRGIQHTTIGGTDYISYKMHRYAKKNGINIKKFPFMYYEYEKPKFISGDRWCDKLIVMQALENMRFQTIFCKRIWSKRTIDSVLQWDNSLLYINMLGEIASFIINWDFGVNMNTKNI